MTAARWTVYTQLVESISNVDEQCKQDPGGAPLERYALVEFFENYTWISTYGSPQDAEEAAEGETENVEDMYLVDLDTGKHWGACVVRTVSFEDPG